MVKALTIVALLVTITAGSILAYRNQPYSIHIERAGEVKKDQEQPSVRAPAVQAPSSFGPVPNVVVQSMPLPAIQESPSTAPTPAPVIKRKPVHKHKAAQKLKSQWQAPVDKPFDIKDLFK